MDKPGGQDSNRTDEQEKGVGQRDKSRTDERANIGQQTGNPAGTSGRDADLQKEGNLGNERKRNTGGDEGEESGMGNRPGQKQ